MTRKLRKSKTKVRSIIRFRVRSTKFLTEKCFTVQLLNDTSAVLIPHKWAPESDIEDSDEVDDGEDVSMAEEKPIVKDDVQEINETKNKKKRKKKKKKNNAKGVILGKFGFWQSQIYSTRDGKKTYIRSCVKV